jgi:hypothetical protein
LHLELNEKTQIFPVKNGVEYLGWRFYLSESGKAVRKLRTANKKRLKRRRSLLHEEYKSGAIDFAAVNRSFVSLHGHLVHGHTYRLRERLYARTVFARERNI